MEKIPKEVIQQELENVLSGAEAQQEESEELQNPLSLTETLKTEDQKDIDTDLPITQIQEDIPELNAPIEGNMIYFFAMVGVAFLVFMVILYKLFPKKAEIVAVIGNTIDDEPTPPSPPTTPLIQPFQTATIDIASAAQRNTLEIPPIFDIPGDTSETVVMIHDAPTLDTPAISVPKSQQPLHNNIDDEEEDEVLSLFGEVKKPAKK